MASRLLGLPGGSSASRLAWWFLGFSASRRISGPLLPVHCWIPLGFPKDISMLFLWDSYGILKGFPWKFFGNSIAFQRDVYGISIGFLWDLNGILYDISKEFLWDLKLISVGFLWYF